MTARGDEIDGRAGSDVGSIFPIEQRKLGQHEGIVGICRGRSIQGQAVRTNGLQFGRIVGTLFPIELQDSSIACEAIQISIDIF